MVFVIQITIGIYPRIYLVDNVVKTNDQDLTADILSISAAAGVSCEQKLVSPWQDTGCRGFFPMPVVISPGRP